MTSEMVHPDDCPCDTCIAIDTGVMLGIVQLEGKYQVRMTGSFKDNLFQRVKQVIELSKNPDGFITDSDEEIFGRAVVTVLSKNYGISNMKEIYNMADLVTKILDMKFDKAGNMDIKNKE
ncbi:MAG: hypothetical protein ACRDFB_03085 [Rhabdochlamydiaceae bacterium]